MGMVACFAAADNATLIQLKSDPESVQEYLYPDDGDGLPPHYVDLDKSWHCIHFMLSGSAGTTEEPISFALLGGDEIGEDMGYGSARLMSPAQVNEIAIKLSSLDELIFKKRYAPAAMLEANIYLSDMCVRDGDDALEYLVSNFHSLVTFYNAAASRGDGAVLWIC